MSQAGIFLLAANAVANGPIHKSFQAMALLKERSDSMSKTPDNDGTVFRFKDGSSLSIRPGSACVATV